MKKIFAIIMCAFIMCALPVVAFAEEEIPDATEEEITEEVTPSTEEETPPVETTPDPNPEAPTEADLITEKIVSYITTEYEWLSVCITMICTVIYQIRKHKVLNKSIVTFNNNSIAVAENSNAAIQHALSGVEDVSTTVANYKNEIGNLLAEVRQNAEDRKRLEAALVGVESYLKTAKLANVELADEVAELLVLANIPNSKKDELYSRHRAAVDAINAVELPTENTEVKGNVEEG